MFVFVSVFVCVGGAFVHKPQLVAVQAASMCVCMCVFVSLFVCVWGGLGC